MNKYQTIITINMLLHWDIIWCIQRNLIREILWNKVHQKEKHGYYDILIIECKCYGVLFGTFFVNSLLHTKCVKLGWREVHHMYDDSIFCVSSCIPLIVSSCTLCCSSSTTTSKEQITSLGCNAILSIMVLN